MEVSSFCVSINVNADLDCLGSPWGAGTVTRSDGSRRPSQLELDVAKKQGKAFYELVARMKFTDEKAEAHAQGK
jgi:hypothetical protein